MTLEIGAGPSSTAEYQIDRVKFINTTHVLDVAIDKLPFPDNHFDEVKAYQILEHIPVVVYLGNPPKSRYCRVEAMREIYRVLKPNGKFYASVPVDFPFWAQDHTHVDVPWTESTFDYFCGGWGGNKPGDFARDSYGIDFQFRWIEKHKGEEDFFNLYVTLQKP